MSDFAIRPISLAGATSGREAPIVELQVPGLPHAQQAAGGSRMPDGGPSAPEGSPVSASAIEGELPAPPLLAPPTPEHGLPKLMTTAEVATFFGCTGHTIRNWRKRRLLRAQRVGGSVFFIEDEVVALLNDEATEEQENANE